MIYDHMNSRFLSEEGVESFVLQFIEREAGSIYDYIDGVGVPGADQRLGKGNPVPIFWSTMRALYGALHGVECWVRKS